MKLDRLIRGSRIFVIEKLARLARVFKGTYLNKVSICCGDEVGE